MANYARTYNSFSGIDITPVFAGQAIGECQGISYSVSREKAPLYTLGSPNPRSFSRGKRGIAGAVVFMVFDRSALFQSLAANSKFYGNTWETPVNMIEKANSSSSIDKGTAVGTLPITPTKGMTLPNKQVMQAYYHDQIPAFDIILLAATERGHGAIMEILGVEILNCGSGISVDDITTDESCTWIGVNIIPWHSQTYNNPADKALTTPYQFNAATASAQSSLATA